MSDNEIIKALECCGVDDCRFCPCYTEDLGCDQNLELLALDLIRRQNIKIEALTNNVEVMTATMRNSAKAERAEARREFAKLIQNKFLTILDDPYNKTVSPDSWATAYESAYQDVDNLLDELEEMEGKADELLITSKRVPGESERSWQDLANCRGV